jgi:cytoskeletal protein CcmA (bactofilin family)
MTKVIGHQSCIGRSENLGHTTNVPQSGTVGGEMIKNIMKGILRDEKGNVLIMVLILLVVGGLILTPLLGLMSTGLLAGQVYERKMDDYYAADAGVEDAIWTIKNDPPNSYPYEYPEPLTVNNRTVDVMVYREDLDPTCAENLTYRILSIAATDDGGGIAAIDSSTTIDAYLSVSYLDLSALLDNAIISDDTIDIKPNNYVDGDVWLPDEEDLETSPGVTINGTVKDNDDMTITWPTAEQLSSYYMEDVEGAPDPGPFIDVQYTNTIGPCYREGSSVVDNTGDPATLVLGGTVYVTGDLEFKQSGSHNYTVDLNGETIFVEGNIDFPSHHVSISGSGCIIAVGDINFHPSIVSGEDEFVLVLSVEGKVDFQPSGDFTGCVAGNVHVQLQPGCTISWISPEGKGLNVPWGVDDGKLPPVTGLSILSWEIE